MTTFLLYDDTLRSHELRHEIGESIADPIGFIEHEGNRIVLASSQEETILSKREDVIDEVWDQHELGYKDLVQNKSFPIELVEAEIVLRALEKLGVGSVVVPPTFQVIVADHLREGGVEVVVDADAWVERRRRKSPWELEGIERAQRATETAMLTAARMLREAEPSVSPPQTLRFEGELLTAELIREAMVAELLSQGAESEDILIHSGDACLEGHDPGTGPIIPDSTCIIDCFPRDRRSGCFTDMTRTFVVGEISDEIRGLHGHCHAAMRIALDAMRPGAADPFVNVTEYFHSQGFPTQLHHDDPGPLSEGFSHGLGHGVGLEVHERPWMGRRADALQTGDVVAVEPGLYFRGLGGVRLEDTVVITENGPEHFTDPYPYDLEP
ncbi:MAG: M24 family metallopeptidase [Actinomycetota bacterium]